MSEERKVWRKKHDRELASGKTISVKKHKMTVHPFDEKKFEPLSDDFAKQMYAQHSMEMNPDTTKTAQIVFLKGNELWVMRPDKYDVLGIDAKDVPEYEKIPATGRPNQIIKVKRGGRMNYYLCDKTGHFKRTFPPEVKKKQAEKRELVKKVEGLKHLTPEEKEMVKKTAENMQNPKKQRGTEEAIREKGLAEQFSKIGLGNPYHDNGRPTEDFNAFMEGAKNTVTNLTYVEQFKQLGLGNPYYNGKTTEKFDAFRYGAQRGFTEETKKVSKLEKGAKPKDPNLIQRRHGKG